jgi:hypothetical protein
MHAKINNSYKRNQEPRNRIGLSKLLQVIYINYKPLMFFFLMIACATEIEAQGRRYRYIGLQPSINTTAVTLDFPPELINLNVAPLTFQTPINEVTDLKIWSLVNYKWKDVPRISSAGLQVVFPRYFKAKQRFSEKSKGWYLGPALGARRSFFTNQYHVFPGLEYGRTFSGEGIISANLSIQLGAEYNLNLNRSNSITPYAGIQLGFGIWVKESIAIRGGAI